MNSLFELTPRDAGVLAQEPEVSFQQGDLATDAGRCVITWCAWRCIGTGKTG